ncbi:hypothetical protein D3C85_1789210 [compost metagenome]
MRLTRICKQDAFVYTNTSRDGLADRPRAYDDNYVVFLLIHTALLTIVVTL